MNKLARFSAIAVAFAAGLVLTGCASAPAQNYAYSPYVNSGPAFVYVQGESYRGAQQSDYQQQQQYQQYQQPYGVQQPRYPYGYQPQQNPGQRFLGTLAGAAVGNAIHPGDAGSIAAGAVLGQVFTGQGDPCAPSIGLGTIVGGAAGYALGGTIGGGDGRKTAQVLGALAGANMGGRSSPGCR
jgi:outer membrane lipoprotein SlyB